MREGERERLLRKYENVSERIGSRESENEIMSLSKLVRESVCVCE